MCVCSCEGTKGCGHIYFLNDVLDPKNPPAYFAEHVVAKNDSGKTCIQPPLPLLSALLTFSHFKTLDPWGDLRPLSKNHQKCWKRSSFPKRFSGGPENGTKVVSVSTGRSEGRTRKWEKFNIIFQPPPTSPSPQIGRIDTRCIGTAQEMHEASSGDHVWLGVCVRV